MDGTTLAMLDIILNEIKADCGDDLTDEEAMGIMVARFFDKDHESIARVSEYGIEYAS